MTIPTGKQTLAAFGWLIGIGLLCVIVFFTAPALVMGWMFHRTITVEQERVLYQLDHPALGVHLREFAAREFWALPKTPKAGVFFYADDPAVPPELKHVQPSSVYIDGEKIHLEFGGPPLHYGIIAFRPGLAGSGTKQIGDGLWFYSENGRFPTSP